MLDLNYLEEEHAKEKDMMYIRMIVKIVHVTTGYVTKLIRRVLEMLLIDQRKPN